MMFYSRSAGGIRGFSRETVVALIANIESQEARRMMNDQRCGPEHPRAASTDDVECFISCIRNDLGATFTVKQLSQRWPIICREFSKRIDNSLPFFYWSTKHDRFREGDRPSFDELPAGETQRLEHHRVRRQEIPTLIVTGRATLPSRTLSVRAQFHQTTNNLAPPVLPLATMQVEGQVSDHRVDTT